MMCKNPYVRVPVGIRRLDTLLSDDARLASTPFPCGQCMHCRINKTREWKHRILLEQLMHEESCFVTITYNDENLPEDGQLSPRELTLFLKRLRKHVYPENIRYFAVGEYGDETWRPHFHMCLFGTMDQEAIEKSWQNKEGESKGFIQVGELNPQSAGYCCGYILKGMTSKKDDRLKEKGLHPEFMRCSKMRPGGLGIEAIKEVAENLCKQKRFKDGLVVRTLKHGKKELPLGRYLTTKLMEFAELDVNDYECDFYDHQEEIFEKHLGKGVPFKDSLISEDLNKMNAVEHNQKIFTKRRVL